MAQWWYSFLTAGPCSERWIEDWDISAATVRGERGGCWNRRGSPSKTFIVSTKPGRRHGGPTAKCWALKTSIRWYSRSSTRPSGLAPLGQAYAVAGPDPDRRGAQARGSGAFRELGAVC